MDEGRSAPDASGVNGGDRPTYTQATARVEYCLTYERCAPRTFYPSELHGPDIPDAFADRFMPGEWYDGDDGPDPDDPEATQADWFAKFAKMAVNEAVHESLEWFKVDDRPWLNPHGDHEREIFRLVNKLCADLAVLAAKGEQPPR